MLDTNHASRLLANDATVLAHVAASNQPIVTSAIVRGELRHMVAQSEQRTANTMRLDALLAHLVILPIDAVVADWYGELKAALIMRFGPAERTQRRRTTVLQLGVSDNDLWIAATAKAHDATIVSQDADFLRIADITDLTVISWLARPA